jgi:2-dehydropantoate 2-reductase
MERVVIAGAGALGSYLAARLHSANLDTHVLARGRRLDSIRRDGIALLTASGISIAKVRADKNWARVERADLAGC